MSSKAFDTSYEAFIAELVHAGLEVRSDPISRAVYSIDASIYEIPPIAIVLPRDKRETVTAVRIAYQHQVPIIPRGAATGISGGCIGKGLVIDLSSTLIIFWK